MLTTHAAGSATVLLIASCSFVFRVVGFIIDDLKKKKTDSLACLPFHYSIYLIPLRISRGIKGPK